MADTQGKAGPDLDGDRAQAMLQAGWDQFELRDRRLAAASFVFDGPASQTAVMVERVGDRLYVRVRGCAHPLALIEPSYGSGQWHQPEHADSIHLTVFEPEGEDALIEMYVRDGETTVCPERPPVRLPNEGMGGAGWHFRRQQAPVAK